MTLSELQTLNLDIVNPAFHVQFHRNYTQYSYRFFHICFILSIESYHIDIIFLTLFLTLLIRLILDPLLIIFELVVFDL
jgi:hypothetical protein